MFWALRNCIQIKVLNCVRKLENGMEKTYNITLNQTMWYLFLNMLERQRQFGLLKKQWDNAI